MNRIYIILILSVIFSSCIKELTDKIDLIDENAWNPKLAAPLANGDFTMGDLAEELTQENLEVVSNNEGTTTFLYRQPSVFSQSASEVFDISDQDFSTSINPPDVPAVSIPGVVVPLEESYTFSFDLASPQGDRIYEILLKSGNLNVVLDGNMPVTGSLNVVFNSLKKNGSPIEINYDWTSTTAQQYSESVDLTEAIVDLRNSDPSQINKFTITVNISINYDGSSISNANKFDLDINLRSLAFEKLTATFANRDILTDPRYFNVEFVDEILRGSYGIDEPEIHFNIKNSIGAPMNVSILSLVSYVENKLPLPLTGSIVNAPIDIDSPTTPGDVKTTRIDINKDNSNIPELINYQPDSIGYAFMGTVNPLNTDDEHFVLDTSKIEANVILEVPMYGHIRNIVLRESYKFNGNDFDEVDNALIKLTAVNGFPLDAKIQAYFIDENADVLDSLFYDDTHVFKAAETDSEGNATQSTESSVKVQVAEDRLDLISDAKRMIIVTLLNTPGNPTNSVRFTEEDKLNVSVFGQTDFDINF